jgi:hypothetical protein
MKKMYIALALTAGSIACLNAMNAPDQTNEPKSPLEKFDDLNHKIYNSDIPDDLVDTVKNKVHPQSPLTTPKNDVFSWEHGYKLEKTPQQIEEENKEMLSLFSNQPNQKPN